MKYEGTKEDAIKKLTDAGFVQDGPEHHADRTSTIQFKKGETELTVWHANQKRFEGKYWIYRYNRASSCMKPLTVGEANSL